MTQVDDPAVAATIDRAAEVCQALAREAGAILRDRLHRARDISFKGAIDMVTDADHASEELIATRIREAFPEHRISGEEGAIGATGATRANQPFGWLIDPLDGTTNYTHRYPHFAVSIALEYQGEPVTGAVYDPMRDELFAARLGMGATLSGEPIHVSETADLSRALMATGFSYEIDERIHAARLWQVFNDRIQGLRRDGAAALNICWTACGRLDGYFERPVQSWDMGAGIVIAREAGATITALEHDRFDVYTPEALVTNGHLHAATRALIAGILANGARGER
ncbi:MAG TPA: inositol monophosphatase family protein [Thermomicrobiales bacterium]|nr:inositol monophosphatase family protein [Thermomicrobiales bacterium]